jgi:hypothetical protein
MHAPNDAMGVPMRPSAMPSVAALVLPVLDLGVEINQAHEAACRAASCAIDHARRAGDLLLEAKAHVQHGSWLPWLEQHCPGLSPRVAQGYMRIAAGWSKLESANTKRDSHLPIRDALKLLTPPREAYNSGEHEWYSPPEYVDAARQVMGAIDLDPMSSSTANNVVQAETYFDAETDGLQQRWRGRLWANPPYTNKTMTAFVTKLITDHEAGDVTEAVVLTNNATDTTWFQALASEADAICLPRGRAHYWRGDNREISSALQGQTVFYLGSNTGTFIEVFGAIGLVVITMNRTTGLAARQELVGFRG